MKMINTILQCFLFVVIGVVVLTLMTDVVSGKTITVDDDGNADFTKIQDAINASEEGDTVRVYEGHYKEHIVMNKTLSLIGNGSANTTIDGGGNGHVVQIYADEVIMSGFNVYGDLNYRQYYGIHMISNNSMLCENICSGNGFGISVIESRACAIINNTCSNNFFGIFLKNSDLCRIENNSCTSSNNRGVLLENSNTCTITNNTCIDNWEGLNLYFSHNSIITNNIFSNREKGIYLRNSSFCRMMNNTMKFDGIFISGNLENWNSHSISPTNSVNGMPVYYGKDTTGITVPSGVGQVILGNCMRVLVEKQNCSNIMVEILIGYSSSISIESNVCSDNEYSICVFSSNSCIITGNLVFGNYIGIWIDNSINCDIINNTYKNNDRGIRLTDSSTCIIENNILENNNIILFGSHNCTITSNIGSLTTPFAIKLYYSPNCTVSNNTCSNSVFGIELSSSNSCIVKDNFCVNNDKGIVLFDSNMCTLMNNTCYLNGERGIDIFSSTACMISNNTCSNSVHGIRLYYSYSNILFNNICKNNENTGLVIYNSVENDIFNNTFTGNKWGLWFEGDSGNNIISYNRIFNNTDEGIEARDNNCNPINATYNYWGSDMGPHNPTDNPDGKGNSISDDVLFRPWLHENGSVNISSYEVPEESSSDDEENHTNFILHSILIIFLIMGALFWKAKDNLTVDHEEGTISSEDPKNDRAREKVKTFLDGKNKDKGTKIERLDEDWTHNMKVENFRIRIRTPLKRKDPKTQIVEV